MAEYQVMYWGDIPYAVRAYEGSKRVSKQLPTDFEKAIDAASMATGKTAQEDYQKGFRWGTRETRDGSADEVAQAVYDDLIAQYPLTRLMEIARQYKVPK
jgi:cvfA/B/C family virulence factor